MPKVVSIGENKVPELKKHMSYVVQGQVGKHEGKTVYHFYECVNHACMPDEIPIMFTVPASATMEEREQAFADAVHKYAESCFRLNRVPKHGFSGRILLRITPSDHLKLATKAGKQRRSINEVINKLIQDYLESEE